MQPQGKQSNGSFYVMLLLVPLFWGGSFGAAKHVITEVPPFTAAAVWFGSAGIILLILVLLKGGWDAKALKSRWLGLLLMAVTGIFAYNAFFFVALQYTSAINGSLIMAVSPVFITLGAVLFLHESWNRRLGIGLLLSFTGVFLVIVNGSLDTLLSLTFNAGDMLFIGALLCWVTHGLIGKAVMEGSSPLLTTTVTTLVGAFVLAICAFFEDGWARVPTMSGQSWVEMVYMTVFATVIAFFLWNKGIHQIGASKSGVYMNLVPINASWIAVLFYGAGLTWQQVIGMAMVFLGVYFATMQNRPEMKWKKPLPQEHVK